MLPDELWGLVFLLLDGETLWHVYTSLICKKWHHLFTTDPAIQRRLHETRWVMYSKERMRCKTYHVRFRLICVAENDIVVADHDHRVYRYTALDQAPHHLFDVAPYPGNMFYHDKTHYIGYHDGRVDVYDDKGARKHSFNTHEDSVWTMVFEHQTTYTVVDRCVYVHNKGTLLYKLEHEKKISSIVRHNGYTYTNTQFGGITQWKEDVAIKYCPIICYPTLLIVYNNQLILGDDRRKYTVDLATFVCTPQTMPFSIFQYFSHKNTMFSVEYSNPSFRVESPYIGHLCVCTHSDYPCNSVHALKDGRIIMTHGKLGSVDSDDMEIRVW